MTSEEATIRSSPLKEKKDDNPTVKTPQQVVEEEKSLKDYKEKKVQAKKRREEKQQREMQKILEEKRILAEELEELKQGLLNEKSNTGDENQVSWSKPSSAEAGLQSDGVDYEEVGNVALKKLGRLRKRYEKKLVAAKEELEDLREVGYFFVWTILCLTTIVLLLGLLFSEEAINGCYVRARKGCKAV